MIEREEEKGRNKQGGRESQRSERKTVAKKRDIVKEQRNDEKRGRGINYVMRERRDVMKREEKGEK